MSVDQQPESDLGDSHECNSPDKRELFLYNPWVVLGFLFFVTLFLGLPLLWLSPRFSARGKVLITIANLVYSALVLWTFYLLMVWCYDRVSGAIRGM